MPPSTSPLAHRDIAGALDRALANGRGVRLRCEDYGMAVTLRQKAYTFRKIDKRESKRIYDSDNPLYNASPYDALVMTPREHDGEWYLYIEVSRAERLADIMEDLPDTSRVLSRAEIEDALDEVALDKTLDDQSYWEVVHKRLGLTFGELFPIMEREGI